jgi:hypothetical protein
LRSIIQAEKEACNRWDLIYDDYTLAISQINLLNGVSSYSLSQKITKIEDIIFNNNPVTKRTKDELDRFTPRWRTDTGIVNAPVYYMIKGRTIKFSPVPDASKDATFLSATAPTATAIGNTWWDTVNLVLYSWSGSAWVLNATAPLGTVYLETYRLPLLDTITTSYVPEIPEEFHKHLIWWVLYEAYSKKDSDGVDGASYDQQKAMMHLAEFDQHFGKPVSSAVRQNQMESPVGGSFRPVDYGMDITKPDNGHDDWNGPWDR